MELSNSSPAVRPDRLLTVHYGLTIFLGAFLLFQVQPIIGKLILPWFGGSASVWTTCMLFFQVLLLGGYLYSHWIVTRLSPRTQILVHVALLAASLFLLPLNVHDGLRPTGAEDPTIRILLLLAVSIGIPYFVLATTGPLVQAWFARERSGTVPYRLFALSNLGSLVALLGYPIAVEPVWPTRTQALSWSFLFVCFTVLLALLAWRGRRLPPAPIGARAFDTRPGATTQLAWIALAACPSILLLAITSHLTANIAPVPLLWVLPLALYLLSFVICFGPRQGYSRRVFRPLLLLSLFAVALMPFGGGELPLLVNVAIHLAALFVVCMVCHGELAMKQPDPRQLTSYYLMVAIGGAMGGLFAGAIAPYWFNDEYELSIGLVLTALVVWLLGTREEKSKERRRRVMDWSFVAVLIVSLTAIRFAHHWEERRSAELVARNFYGRIKVSAGEDGGGAFRFLMHGGVLHGLQFTAPGAQDQATTYYSPESGVGRTLLALQGQAPMNIGLVGLGVGTLLTYGRSGDYFRLYDIDPLVVDVARTHFSYLRRTAAHTAVVLGDARLSLERETPQGFDVLVVDAFSGDSVPVHLLTQEAFLGYFKHVKPNGVVAVHVTNHFLNLHQVVKAVADGIGRQAMMVSRPPFLERKVVASQWILVSADPSFFTRPGIREVATEIEVPSGIEVWRDDYSSLLRVIRWGIGKKVPTAAATSGPS